MRTTIIIKDDIIKRAREMTGIKRKTDLVHAGLEMLIQHEVAKALVALGGSDPTAFAPPRRRVARRAAARGSATRRRRAA
ncbi:MAG: type II toxin-antitoxin system VapB family antitoxin [Phycisphaerales bacterium]